MAQIDDTIATYLTAIDQRHPPSLRTEGRLM